MNDWRMERPVLKYDYANDAYMLIDKFGLIVSHKRNEIKQDPDGGLEKLHNMIRLSSGPSGRARKEYGCRVVEVYNVHVFGGHDLEDNVFKSGHVTTMGKALKILADKVEKYHPTVKPEAYHVYNPSSNMPHSLEIGGNVYGYVWSELVPESQVEDE